MGVVVVAVVEVPGEGSEMRGVAVEKEDVVGDAEADVSDASDIDTLLLATDIHK